MKLQAVPFWVVAALQEANLRELHRKTGISRRQLIRIKNRETKWIRDDTLRKLIPHLSKLGRSDPQVEEFIYQLAQRVDLQVLFDMLQDPLQIGLEIHKKMVELGWDVTHLVAECREWALARKLAKERGRGEEKGDQAQAIESSDSDSDEGLFPEELAAREIERFLGPELGLDGRKLRERIKEILAGDRITLEELCLIAEALGVTPGELFVGDLHGYSLFCRLLQESKHKGDTETSKFLKQLRNLLNF